MTSTDINRAVARLRNLNRDEGGTEAYAHAAQIPTVAAHYRAPADQCALWIVAIGLYYVAAMGTPEASGYATLVKIIEDHYESLRRGLPLEKMFSVSAVDYPEQLQNYARALSQLPSPLVLSAMESAQCILADIS